MSGGVAYIYDPDSAFEARCNTGMVDVEPLGSDDHARLKNLLTRHANYTGSEIAKRLLASWDRSLTKFVRVMPREYKKVLAAEKYDTELSLLATV
jgi:glutamate synthase (NADPH/NADH) large chain